MRLSNLAKTKSQKYEFVKGDTKVVGGHLVQRIRCITTRFVDEVYYGGYIDYNDYGGYIESETNLSQSGTSWVKDGAVVYGPIIIDGSSWAYENGFNFQDSNIETLKNIPKYNELSLHLCPNIHGYDGPDEAYADFIVYTNTHFSVKNIPLDSENLSLTAIEHGKLLHLPHLIKYNNVFLNIVNKGSGLSEINTVL